MKIKRFMVATATLFLLAGCGYADYTGNAGIQNEETPKRFQDTYGEITGLRYSITTDTATGCQYLVRTWGNGAGITALLDENGKPVGCRGLTIKTESKK